ncbi:MAG: DUF2283 domain-containing protein [bacterium]|nr:DUF2283 domain-containing protein [bacterium]
MKLTYDPEYNIAYISFREKIEQVETIQISEELNIDISPDGTVYGIELLNARDQLGAMVIIDRESGESETIKLAV